MRRVATLAAIGLFVVAAGQVLAQMPTGGRPDRAPAQADSALSADQAVAFSGTVTAVDAANGNFTCHGASGDRTFQTDAQTRIQAGNSPVRLGDIKTGSTVSVVSHRSQDNTQDIADEVTVQP